MRKVAEHLEIYLDHNSQPLRVLSTPPFEVQIDTRNLSDGLHELGLVTFFKDGSKERRTLSFTVHNFADTVVEGLNEGDTVRGVLDLNFKPGSYDISTAVRRTSLWLYIVSPVVLLFAVWGFFVLTGPLGNFPATGPVKASSAAKRNPILPAPVDPALWKEGQGIYAKSCSACHLETGEGVPHVFPPLAANANLGDTGFVIETVYRGKSGAVEVNGKSYTGTMGAVGAKFSDKELASVASYIRNNWGNTFGGVTENQVGQILAGGPGQVGGR